MIIFAGQVVMENKFRTILDTFQANVNAIKELMVFDRFILDVAIKILEDRIELLKTRHKFDNPNLTGENAIMALKNVRGHGSLKDKYEMMYNQCVVLLVAHFGSTIKELFRAYIDFMLTLNPPGPIGDQQIKISLAELQVIRAECTLSLGQYWLDHREISVQDMQSISRFMREYVGCAPEWDDCVNDIILAQAARHLIVHTDGKVNEQFLRQIGNVNAKSTAQTYALGEPILFEPHEVSRISDHMTEYLGKISHLMMSKVDNGYEVSGERQGPDTN